MPGGWHVVTVDRQLEAGPFTDADILTALTRVPPATGMQLGQRNRTRRTQTRFGVLWTARGWNCGAGGADLVAGLAWRRARKGRHPMVGPLRLARSRSGGRRAGRAFDTVGYHDPQPHFWRRLNRGISHSQRTSAGGHDAHNP